ncbi:MAG: RMD1 family protein [Oleiphilaceae bacterium]|nr:RMD1 family protein [Oleiphilaceae bacterium]
MPQANTSNTTSTLRITITHLGENIDKALTETTLVNKLGAVRYRDAYCIMPPHGECWLFDYGVLVAWDLSENDRQSVLHELAPLIVEPLEQSSKEQYSYMVELGQPLQIHHDLLSLPNDEALTRLALSHAFAQSAKLGFFEDRAQEMIQNNAHISRNLAQQGKVSLNRKQLAKLRGMLFDTISDITLHFGLLDTPEFFWDYPELEETYCKLAKYLDLQPRVEILNKKLATLQSLLDMLAAEQNHKHSAFLEWVIIWLIAVDIAIYFF